MKALEFASDLMVLTGQTEVTPYPNRIIQISLDEPNFWFGNRVIFHDAPTDAEALIAQFRRDVPDANHICVAWDIPNLELALVEQVFAGTGLKVEQADTLTLSGALHRTNPPEGIEIRPLKQAEDWRQSEDICFDEQIRDGLPEKGMRGFLENRTRARKNQIAKGLGQWFGAFSGDQLAGDMGIFHDAHVIRYQSVQTHDDFRRRGVCSSLLCASLDWARKRAPDAIPVIVAIADSDAGRLYRRAGFELAETTISAYRPPLDTP